MPFSHSPPRLLQTLTSPWLTWRMPPGRKRLYLSFDDGPYPCCTPGVLELLGHYRAKASFFMTGKQAGQYPALLSRIVAEGHSTGNHTYDHPDGWRTTSGTYFENVQRAAAILPSQMFRPPYGRITPRQSIKLIRSGYRLFMWSVMSCDYDSSRPAERMLQQTLDACFDGAILVFHDSPAARGRTLPLLEGVLSHYSRQGFVFPPLPPPQLA